MGNPGRDTHLNLRVGLVVGVGVMLAGVVLRWECRGIVSLGDLTSQIVTIVRVVLVPTLGHARGLTTTSIWLRRAHDDAVVSVSLDMLLEILGALEGLAAELALMRLQRNVHADVRGDVVALDRGGAALAPGAGQVEVVGGLAADMALAHVLLEGWLVDATRRSRFGTVHRAPLDSGIARRSPATGTAGSRLRPRPTTTAGRWVGPADLAVQERSPGVQQARRPGGFGWVVQTLSAANWRMGAKRRQPRVRSQATTTQVNSSAKL